MKETPRFYADAMLGRLARWLRVLDFDTLYEAAVEDHDLVTVADYERRIVLTRDRHLIAHLRPARGLLIRSQEPLAQLREAVDVYRLGPPAECFVRCMVCNTPLRPLDEEELALLVPEDVDVPRERARRCPGCMRVYWPGSHTRRMLQRLRANFPEWPL